MLSSRVLLNNLSARTHHAAFVATAIRSFCSPAAPKLQPDIHFDELHKKLGSRDLTLIDVRTANELTELGSVPGAVHLPLQRLGTFILLSDEEFEDNAGWKKPDADEPLIVMCMAGVRAQTAQLALQAAGYTNVRRYLGSFTDWEEKGGNIDKVLGHDPSE